MMDVVPPSNIGEFKVEGSLGRGPIGQMYSASHTYGLPAVLTVVDSVHTSSPGFRGRLVQYSQAINGWSHQNVVRVYKCGEHEALTYIFTEAVAGGALKSVPTDGPWTPARWAIVGLIKQAADGLAAAHARGLVHGNLSLASLLLTTTDIASAKVKVSDVGWAALVGNAEPVGPEHDIAGLGALLQLATGQASSKGDLSGVPDDLKQVVLRCLSTDPTTRFSSCQAVSDALRTLLEAARTEAHQVADREAPPVAPKTREAVPPERKDMNPPRPPGPLPAGGPLVPCLHAFDRDHTPIDRQYLRASGLTVGREPGKNIIALPSASVSAVHAKIDWDTRRVMITDLASANGTFLQDSRLLPQMPHEWGPDQWVQIGTYWLWLQRPPINTPPPLVTELVLDRDSRTMTLTPGKNAVCRLTLVNQRPNVDHVKLSVEGIPEEWVELPRTSQQLNPSDTVELTIPINVPRSPASRARRYDVTFIATSSIQDAKPGTAKATWTVLPFEATSVSITPSRGAGSRGARYTVRLQSDGNDDFSYQLTGTDDERQLACVFADGPIESSGPQIDLEWTRDGARRDLRVNVSGERRWVGNSKSYPFTVQARPAKGDQILTASAHFVQRAVFPYWLLALIPVVLIALIFVLPQFFRPVMRDLTIQPRNPRPGEKVEAIWNASGGTVRVLVDGAVVADTDQPQGRHVFSEGFEKDSVVRVVASNIFGSGQNSARELPVKLRDRAPLPAAVVELFEVMPRTVVTGQPVTIRWRTRGAVKVDLQPLGTVDLEGSMSSNPTEDVSYTLVATNPDNMTTTRTIQVRVGLPPIRLEFSASSQEARRDAQGMLVGVGQFVIFQWRADNATSVRINAIAPASLEGQSGQKTAQLRGEGTYTFTLVAMDEKGQEVRSKPIDVRATCKGLPARVITFRFGCNKNPELRWQ